MFQAIGGIDKEAYYLMIVASVPAISQYRSITESCCEIAARPNSLESWGFFGCVPFRTGIATFMSSKSRVRVIFEDEFGVVEDSCDKISFCDLVFKD